MTFTSVTLVTDTGLRIEQPEDTELANTLDALYTDGEMKQAGLICPRKDGGESLLTLTSSGYSCIRTRVGTGAESQEQAEMSLILDPKNAYEIWLEFLIAHRS